MRAGIQPPRLVWLERAAQHLSNSRVVIAPKGTHLMTTVCTDQIILQFIHQASTAGLETGCSDQIYNPPFATIPSR